MSDVSGAIRAMEVGAGLPRMAQDVHSAEICIYVEMEPSEHEDDETIDRLKRWLNELVGGLEHDLEREDGIKMAEGEISLDFEGKFVWKEREPRCLICEQKAEDHSKYCRACNLRFKGGRV